MVVGAMLGLSQRSSPGQADKRHWSSKQAVAVPWLSDCSEDHMYQLGFTKEKLYCYISVSTLESQNHQSEVEDLELTAEYCASLYWDPKGARRVSEKLWDACRRQWQGLHVLQRSRSKMSLSFLFLFCPGYNPVSWRHLFQVSLCL